MKYLSKLSQLKSLLASPFSNQEKELEALLDNSPELKHDLERSLKQFEQQFLDVVSTLEDLQTTSEELSESSSTMLELSNSDSNPINSIILRLEPNLDFIKSSSDSINTIVETLKSSKTRIETALNYEPQLDNTFSQLTYIRTLFAVEAAPLEQTDKVMFTSLVEEIYRLQTDVTSIFSKNFSALKEHGTTINSLATQLENQAKTQNSIYKESKTQMEQSVSIQTETQGVDMVINEELKTQSEQISNAIGTAIISLQTQDIVTQKISHIFETCEEISSRFETAKLSKNKKEKASELRFVENAALIVCGQIESIKAELKSADNSIESSVQEIISSIRSMDRSTKSSGKNLSNSDSEKDRGGSLISVLKRSGDIVSTIEGFLTQSFKTIEPIRGQTSDVTSTITVLSSQLHLIGLNAEIHAARTGGSTALETLSANTSALSVETRELCRCISGQLDALADTLRENVNELEAIQGSAQQALSDISRDIPREVENSRIQTEKYSQAQSKASLVTERLRRLIENQRDRLDFEETMIQALEALQESQRNISNLSGKAADKYSKNVEIPESVDSLTSRYTMVSETDAHNKALGLQPTDSFSRASSVEFSADKVDNVEMFGDDFSAPDSRLTETTEANEQEEDKIEFF